MKMDHKPREKNHEPGMPVGFELASNLIVVDAAINGVGKRMILDTGAGATIIDREIARQLGLKESSTCAGRGAGGDVDLTAVEVESLSVGGRVRRDFTGMSMNMADVCERVGQDIDGIIGFDFLSSYLVTIDYPSRTVSLA